MDSKTKGIIVYLIITFGLAWGIWGILFQAGISPRDPRFQVWGTIPGFAPAIAAILVRMWITREGFADAGLNPNIRMWRYYLGAWLFPILIASVITGLAVMLRISSPDPTLERAYQILTPGSPPPAPLINLPLPIMPMVLVFITTFVIWGEEFGWRGYLQMHLFDQQPILASAATGLIWGIWHLPLIIASGDQYADTPLLGAIIFPITAILLSIIWGWLRIKTDSVWASCVAHAATNSLGSLMMISLFYGSENWTFVSYFGVLSWLPLGAICIWLIKSGQFEKAAA